MLPMWHSKLLLSKVIKNKKMVQEYPNVRENNTTEDGD